MFHFRQLEKSVIVNKKNGFQPSFEKKILPKLICVKIKKKENQSGPIHRELSINHQHQQHQKF